MNHLAMGRTPRGNDGGDAPASVAPPEVNAWMWHLQAPGETMLSRREAAVLDVVRCAGPEGIVTGQIMAAIEGGARFAAWLESRPHEPVSRLRTASFYDVMGTLVEKGLVEVVGSERGGGRPARRCALTDLGEQAATFARAVAAGIVRVGNAAAESRDQVGTDLMTLLVTTRCGHAVMTSDGGGYRVDKVHDGRYLGICEGPPDGHATILSWLRARAGLPPDDATAEGSFTHRSSDGRATTEVTVRVTRELVGHRTTIALRPV